MDRKKDCTWKISVIIPVYNSERFLGDCIDSVLEQTYQNLEIILIEDGSTDDSRNICEAYCRKDPRVRLLCQDHKGVSAARNHGLEALTGEYVFFLDSDDLIHPALIEQYMIRVKESASDYIFCGYTPFVTLPESLKTADMESPELIVYSAQRARKLFYYSSFFREIGGKLIRTEYIGETRFAESVIWGEDVLFNYEMILKNGTFSFFNVGWYYYRKHADSAGATINDRGVEKLKYMKVLRDYEYSHADQSEDAFHNALLWENKFIHMASSEYIRARREGNRSSCRELRNSYRTERKNPLLKELPLSERAYFYISFNTSLITCRAVLKAYHLGKKYLHGFNPAHDTKKPVFRVAQTGDCKRISITFDATYGADNTGRILRVLNQYGIRATFFVSGIWAEAYPQKVREIIAAGCEVGNHSDTHPHLRDWPKNNAAEEIENCSKKIEDVAGVRPKFMRCPYGEYNDNLLELIEQMGLLAIQYSIDSQDWKVEVTADDIYQRIVSQVSPGDIILCHNGGLCTVAALEEVLDTLLEQGYEFVTVSELLRT